MEPSIRLRPAVAADEPVLGRLGALLVRVHHDLDPLRFVAPGPGSAAGYGRFLAGRIGRPRDLVVVAEADGAVVGYAWAALEEACWEDLRGPAGVLHDVAVEEGARRRGAGRALVEAALAWLEERGAPRVVVRAASGNEASLRLFRALGFRSTMEELTREAGGPAGGAHLS